MSDEKDTKDAILQQVVENHNGFKERQAAAASGEAEAFGGDKAAEEEKPKIIDKLTPEQESQLDVYYQRWLAIGTSTEGTDFERAREALRLVYTCAGQEPPGEILHMKSPMAAAEWEKAQGLSTNGVGSVIYGNHDASWLGFYEYMHEVVGIDCSELRGLWTLAREAGWCWVYDDVAVITDRPSALNTDEQGNLHCEDGPAIAYGDDFKLYFWHGVSVEEYIIERPEEITVEKIKEERNAEIVRVMIERFGAGRYLEEMNAEPVGEPFNGSQLYEMELHDNTRIARVRAVNSTPEPDGTSKIYWLKVPTGLSCAHEALAAIHPDPFRKHWSEYGPEVET